MSLFALLPLLALPAVAASKKEQPGKAPATAAMFAPVPETHELASIWNDPDFQRRLIGGYGFLSEAEPRMQPEEQQFYNEKIRPLLQPDPRTNLPPDRRKAIPVLQSRVSTNASAQFDYLLGTIFFEHEDLTNAVKHFEAAVAKFPDFRRAQRNLAFALVRDGKYNEAVKPLTRTIALGGGDGRVFGLLGFAYMNQGRYVSAEGAYRQAVVFEPENVDFKLGLVKCSVATANYDYALALLDELIQQFPERDSLWTLQANIFIQKEQPAKAAVSLEMLRRLGKATPQSLFLLGDLYMAQEARDLALGAYLEAAEKDDGKQIVKALRAADILVSRGAWKEASALFKKIRDAQGAKLSDDDRMKLLKLESKVAMAAGEGDKAIKTLEEIIGKNPLDGEALLLAGDYYAKNEQREKAEFRYQTAASLENFKADAWVKHAQLLVAAKKYNEAVELLKRAQKLKPRDHIQRYLEKVEVVAGRSARS